MKYQPEKKKSRFFCRTNCQLIENYNLLFVCLFIYCYLNWNQITISYRKCFCRVPCRNVSWSNAGYCSLIHLSDHADQIDIRQFGFLFCLGFLFLFFFFFLFPAFFFFPEADAQITMVNWMTRSSSAIYHSSNNCFLIWLRELLISICIPALT